MSAPRSTRPHFDQPLRLISWNVNSVRRRLDQVIRVIDRWEPDVICLQELKAKEDVVPVDAIAAGSGQRPA